MHRDGFYPPRRFPGDACQLAPERPAKATTYRAVQKSRELDPLAGASWRASSAAVSKRMYAYDNLILRADHGFVDAAVELFVRRSRARYWVARTADNSTPTGLFTNA